MGEPTPLRRAIERVENGAIRIPGFQRKFIWQPSRAALLMDSLYKGYPFGSVLLWRTRTELKTEKNVGGFELPEPEKDYPIDYVLDGQQRLTSIFATFQTHLDPPEEDPEVWLPIYYDFEAINDAQESHFVALGSENVSPDRHFPLSSFFDPVAFARSVSALTDERNIEIVQVQEKFKEALIPTETFETEDRASVAIVFERVNRMGVPLDIFELLTAWTWSEEFDLQDRFNELAEEFESFGFDDVGTDNDLMLRCCAAILKGDPSPASMIDINGASVRANFEMVEKSLRLAIDFLRDNLNVRHLKFLPYSAQLIPLTAYFSVDQSKSTPASHREALVRWFWRSSLMHRYSGNPGRNIKSDVEQAVALRTGNASSIDDIPYSISPGFFLTNAFSSRTVASKTLILMLASQHPKSFLSGQAVSLNEVLSEPNRREFHHCAPKAWLTKEFPDFAYDRNALANFAMISRAENREIKAKAPSEYRTLMPEDITSIADAAKLPPTLWTDDPTSFFDDRAELLRGLALDLVK